MIPYDSLNSPTLFFFCLMYLPLLILTMSTFKTHNMILIYCGQNVEYVEA